jgi:multiple sugar transport system substrate-binding protein
LLSASRATADTPQKWPPFVSRRRFLSTFGVALGGAIAVACAAPAPSSSSQPTAAPAAAPTTAPAAKPTSAPAAQPTTAAAAAPTTAPAAAASTPAAGGASALQGYKGAAPTDQQVTLRFLRQTYGDPQEAYYKDIYTQWAALYPNIKVQEEPVPFGQLFTKVQTEAASGDPPDIMMGQGDFTRNYVFGKLALPLDDYLTADHIKDYFPALRQMATVDNKLYLAPYELQVSVMVYDADALKQAGVDMPPQSPDSNAGWTWDQWLDAMRKLKAAQPASGDQPWPLAASDYGPGGPGSNYWHEGILIRSNGDPNAAKDSTAYKTWAGISDDGLTATGYVDTPEAIAAMKMYQTWFNEKLTPTGAMSNSFYDGKALISWAGGQAWTFLPQFNVKFKAGITSNPKGKVQFTHVSGDSPFVSAKSKHPAEAVAFLTFLTNDKNRIAWDKAWGPIPARQSVMAQLPKFKEYPYNMMVDEVSKFGTPAPLTPGTLEYETAMNEAIKDIALGADPEPRLHQAAQEIDDTLSKYKQ